MKQSEPEVKELLAVSGGLVACGIKTSLTWDKIAPEWFRKISID